MIEASGTKMQLGRRIGHEQWRKAKVRLRRVEGRRIDGGGGGGGDRARHKHREEGAGRAEKRPREGHMSGGRSGFQKKKREKRGMGSSRAGERGGGGVGVEEEGDRVLLSTLGTHKRDGEVSHSHREIENLSQRREEIASFSRN